MEPICQHSRTDVIARRDGIDYVECLDCRQIFEAEDLDSVPGYDEDEQASNLRKTPWRVRFQH